VTDAAARSTAAEVGFVEAVGRVGGVADALGVSRPGGGEWQDGEEEEGNSSWQWEEAVPHWR
jgi:hypothetical protein